MKTLKLVTPFERITQGRKLVAGQHVATVVTDIPLSTLVGMLNAQSLTVEEGESVEVESPLKDDSPNDPPQENTGFETGSESESGNDESNEEPKGPDPLVEAGLSEAIASRLNANATALNDDRLRTPDGVREWVAEGGDLNEDLDQIGPRYAERITEVLGIKPADPSGSDSSPEDQSGSTEDPPEN